MTGDARDPDYFDRLYAASPDPWNFTTSAYERDKYAATLTALPRDRYARVLEVGCSIGILTEQLAARGDEVVGIDVAQAAIDQARHRTADHAHLHFARMRFPAETPPGRFDLVLLSEVLYYFDAATMPSVAAAVAALSTPGADIVLVHWLGPTPDYPLDGDGAVAAFIAAARLAVVRAERHPDYRLDVLRDPRAA